MSARSGSRETKPHIKRPTAEEISAVLSPSSETEFVELHKPTYDYLKANLPSDDAVSEYVSGRITSELVRLSKMTDGRSNWDKVSATQRAANASSRWRKYHAEVASGEREPHKSVRVRAYGETHRAYMACAGRKQERTRVMGERIITALGTADRTALLAYCESHKAKPQQFVTLPEEAVSRTRELADEIGVPFTKIVNYLICANG